MELSSLIRDFGFPIVMALILVGTFVWVVRIAIIHFIKSINEATIERKELTLKFATVVENHIAHNTEALQALCGKMAEGSEEHKEFMQELRRAKN